MECRLVGVNAEECGSSVRRYSDCVAGYSMLRN